jgi:hypothetical protein
MTNTFYQPQSNLLAAIEQEADYRNIFNNYHKALNGNEKIIAEQWLNNEIKSCQLAMSSWPMQSIDFLPQLTGQDNFIMGLPESLRSVALHLSAETGFDYLTCVMAVLTTISIALCGRFTIQLTQDWREAISLYTMLIAPSGSKKSSLMRAMKEPLAQVMGTEQAKYNQNANELKQKYNLKKKALESRRNADMKEKVNACHDPEHGSDYDKLTKEMDELNERITPAFKKNDRDKPGVCPNLFLSDCTEKALLEALRSQGEHQASMEDEAGLIEKIISLGSRFNIDVLLKGSDQASFHYQKGKTPLQLKNPSLNLFYTVQPKLASMFFMKNSENDRGLAARFIPVFAQHNQANGQPSVWQTQNRQDFEAYRERVKHFLKLMFTQDPKREIFNLQVEQADVTRLLKFEAENLAQAKNGYGHMESFLGKLHGKAIRIAGIIHLWNVIPPPLKPETDMWTISTEAVAAGITIAQALIIHANHAFNESGLLGLEPANRIFNWIRSSGIKYFSYRETKQALDSSLKGELVRSGLKRLIQCNILGEKFDHKGLPVYVVHPFITGWFGPPAIMQPSSMMLPMASPGGTLPSLLQPPLLPPAKTYI